MSEFSFPANTNKKAKFSSLLLSDLLLFCSFIISHPLYFSYFIFFSPYIIKILSFLSPLFITTSLLLLTLLTTFVRDTELCANSKVSFLLSAYRNAVEKLRSNSDDSTTDEQSLNLEDLEAYKIVFDTSSIIEVGEISVGVSEETNGLSSSNSEAAPVDKHLCRESLVEIITLAEIMKAESDRQQSSRGFLEEEDHDVFVDVSCEKGEKEEVKPSSVGLHNNNNNNDKAEETKVDLFMSSGSKALENKVRLNSQRVLLLGGGDHLWSDENDGGEFTHSPSFGSSLGSFGSMRKEKEWRRTLACKLFEERHNNVDQGSCEGMDMLWETYEADHESTKQQQRQQLLAKSKTKKGKKWRSKYDDDEEEDEEEIDDGQLCCLQALKFSAGKMNLGMGRPNLVKISKAFKGIGWLHNVTKHGKKIYH
ncbi:hypothetical protein CISIN_1g040657mg [Citrus sinensis]|uniref:Uncharacterized protein n=1 Tax=Citrus sinensis TaxID=2711 RepID=A0A067FS04_CITSI|nr:hypothetical protein CISIN_1g040657mg [Citrus sinensis]